MGGYSANYQVQVCQTEELRLEVSYSLDQDKQLERIVNLSQYQNDDDAGLKRSFFENLNIN